VAASLIGRKLGKYEITELIGHGGMATVYKGYQRDIDRHVAVKVMPPHPGQDSNYVERFRLEARTVARLQHPHILPIYDYGDENGILYLVMALAEGGTLSDLIRRGPMAPEEVERLMRQVTSALDYAHRQGIIHRDIKPDNIMLNREGYTLLGDFGIVKIIEGSSGMTVTGGLVGTPSYMSPEQGQGLPVDRRSDLYSLGVVMYEMLTGTQPYSAETPMQIVFKHITEPTPDILSIRPTLPPSLSEVMRKALAKEPAARYGSAKDLMDDFSRAIRGDTLIIAPGANPTLRPEAQQTVEASAARQPAATEQLQPTMAVTQQTVNPVILLGGFAIIAVLLVAIVLVVLNFWQGNQPPAPTPEPTAAVAVVPSVPTFGRVSFSTNSVSGDTARLEVENLPPPPSGQQYIAWLGDGESSWIKLGNLRLDPLGGAALIYTDGEARNLATLYNRVVITLETEDVDAPGEAIAYNGEVPQAVTDALREIVVSSAEGFGNASLLESALIEARIARQHAGLAASASSVGGLHTHAEHTINILRGTNEDFTGDGRGDNPGRGVGVIHFVDLINAHLDAAASASNETRQVQSQVELIRVCTANASNWIDQVIALEMQLVQATDVPAVAAQQTESTELAAALMEGTDLNQNGQVDPFEGECGLEQIMTYSIAVGNMDIVSVDGA
jgi:tRNA A-37 threonylcarbamoyl transferase component Bud32